MLSVEHDGGFPWKSTRLLSRRRTRVLKWQRHHDHVGRKPNNLLLLTPALGIFVSCTVTCIAPQVYTISFAKYRTDKYHRRLLCRYKHCGAYHLIRIFKTVLLRVQRVVWDKIHYFSCHIFGVTASSSKSDDDAVNARSFCEIRKASYTRSQLDGTQV